MLAEVMKSDETLAEHLAKSVTQSSLGNATKAPMIKPEFGQISMSLGSDEIQARFNALHGSNTRPRAIFAEAEGEHGAKLLGQNIYFDSLVPASDSFLESVDVVKGTLVCNRKAVKDKVFIKTGDGWVSFGSTTLPIGKFSAQQLMQRILTKKMEGKFVLT